MKKKGLLIVVSGFAGSGKGTIMKELINRYDNYKLSVSATTRSPRPMEEEGVSYFFKTKEQFEKMIDKGELLEYANYVGNYYGTPRAFVEETLKEGKDVILEIEYMGAFKVKAKFPEAVLLFICPPTVDEIYARLKKRGTETEDIIRKRLVRGEEEATIISQYDYLIVNDDLESCILDVHNTIQSTKNTANRNKEFIEELKSGFAEFLGR